MKEGKFFRKVGRGIVDRALMKRTRANKYGAYLSALTSGKGGFRSSKRAGKRGGSRKCLRAAGGFECRSSLQCSCRAVLHNYGNFRNSGVPARLMYFWNGTWNEFCGETSDMLREAFIAGKPTVEVVIDGSPYLVDFLQMLQIDLGAGCQRSIAWIDKNGSCFFPKVFFEDSNVDGEAAPQVEVEIEIRISPSEGSKTENCERGVSLEPYSEVSKTDKYAQTDRYGLVGGGLEHLSEVSKTENYRLAGSLEPLAEVCVNGLKTRKLPVKTSIDFPAGTDESERDSSDASNPTAVSGSECSKESVLEEEAAVGIIDASRGLESWQSGSCETPDLVDKLIKLEHGDDDYATVQNKFLAGFGKLGAMIAVAGIYRNAHASTFGKSWLEAFQRQVEITREARGNANVGYAWHGTCGKGAAGIILNGFCQPRRSDNGTAYSTGICLAPEDCSQLGAAFSDVDKNGERYVVLCRVIMGNMERVCYGSDQFYPSSDKFDSGVDDLNNPKCYIVWAAHVNTHILPEYIVSFKIPRQLDEYWSGLKAKQGAFGFSKPLNHSSQHVQLACLGSFCEEAGAEQSFPVVVKEEQHKMDGTSKEAAHMTSSTSMSFPKLFSVIGRFLPATSIKSLEGLYTEYKAGRIGKDILIRRVRMIAGDKLLIAAIQSIRGQTNGTQMIGRRECSPHSVLASEKPDLENECTTFKNQADCMQVLDRTGCASNSLLDSSKQHLGNDFTSLGKQASEIGGQSGLDDQSLSRLKAVMKRHQSFCETEP